MGEMRKITAFVPTSLLESAQAFTGAGVTETLRQALEMMAYERFYQGMRELRGKVKFDISLDELKEDKEYDEHGYPL